jgi:UDPglucose 6-dehydrogenase
MKGIHISVATALIIFGIHCRLIGIQRVAVIGTGYVGLVTAAGLAESGNQVTGADIDEKKIAALQAGIIPIYEPGLDTLVYDNVANGRLTFTSDVAGAIRDNDIIMIAVGTPMTDNGAADMRYVASVVDSIAASLHSFKLLCVKSTVPVGTGAWIRGLLESKGVDSSAFGMVSNPEFLREGSAVIDFLQPDRIVVGTETSDARDIMQDLYAAFITSGTPFIATSVTSSELIKYGSNAFLAVKVSFINEMANLCDAVGADIKEVAYAMGCDRRISPHFLRPGPGFGGSCFPKDSSALLYTAAQHDVDLKLVAASLIVNELQKERPVQKLLHLFNGSLQGKTVAVWGLAFKGNTDDIRYSPAAVTVERLLEAGAQVQAYDPAAMDNMRAIIPTIIYCTDMYQAVQGADALVVMTEWDIFSRADMSIVADLMRQKVVVDARNSIDPQALKANGFTFDTIGRSVIAGN